MNKIDVSRIHVSMETVKPYNQGGKKEEVEQMFDQIAHSYDFLNHFFSLGIDIIWRKRAIRIFEEISPEESTRCGYGNSRFRAASGKV